MYRPSYSYRGDEAKRTFPISQVYYYILKPIQRLCPIATSGLGTPPASSDAVEEGGTADLADEITKEHELYPETELQWLATMSFNRAVDYYVQGDEGKAKRWADKAFVVAQWIEDEGRTRDFLMDRFSSLQFSAE